MEVLKRIAKSFFAYKAQQYVTPLEGLVYLGSTYHGYSIPDNYLSESSVCYCVGAGTDISLDIELVTKFRAQVFIFDPMPYALSHFKDLIRETKLGKKFTANNDIEGYTYRIAFEQLDTEPV
jgi:hypothetical protein